MNKNDFKIIKRLETNDINSQHEDYLIEIIDTNLYAEIFKRFSDMCVEYIDLIYSYDENTVYVKRYYRFNFDVVSCPTDCDVDFDIRELEEVLKELVDDFRS